MTEVSRECRQSALHILAGLIPAPQGLHGESMPKVVQSGALMGGRSAQADLPRQRPKHPIDVGSLQGRSHLGQEEVRGSRNRALGKKAVAMFGIRGERL